MKRKKQKFQPRPWFRHYAGARHDAKLKLISFDDQRHYWCINEMKCEGELDKDDQSAELLERMMGAGLGLDQVNLAEVKRRLVDVGLIGPDWQPLAWDKRQFEGDYSSDRVKRHRDKVKRSCNVTETLQGRYGNAPEAEAEADTEKNPDRTRAREPALPKGAARGAPARYQPDRRPATRSEAAMAIHEIIARAAPPGGGG